MAHRWVRVQLTDTGALVEPMARVRARFPFAVEMHRRVVAVSQRATVSASTTERASTHPLTSVAAFWRATTGGEPSRDALGRLHDALVVAGAPPIDLAAVADSTDAPDPHDRSVDGGESPTLFDDSEFVRVGAERPRSRRLRPAS